MKTRRSGAILLVLSFAAAILVPIQNSDERVAEPSGEFNLSLCWSSIGDNKRKASFGVRVSSGDANGDGFSDVLVGAYFYNTDQINAGKAFLYLGSATGLSQDPAWTSSGDDQYSAWFGVSVAFVGDVNGDGLDDVLISANGYDTDKENAGKVYLFYGNSTGLTVDPVWTSSGDNVERAFFGTSSGVAGDVNGDGYYDVVVGAPYVNDSRGKSFVYLGGPQGPEDSPAWTSTGYSQPRSGYGISVSTAGDVDNDGFDDVLVGAWGHNRTGKAYLYHGSTSGPSLNPNWTSSGDMSYGQRFGSDLASAGDVNGDGFDDVIVGAYLHSGYRGKAYLYQGSASGLSENADWESLGEQSGSLHATSVSTAGDLNRDGHEEVLIGAGAFNGEGASSGKVYVFEGSPAGLKSLPSWTTTGDGQAFALLGDSVLGGTVSSAGDVNGDGFLEIIAAAPWYDSDKEDVGKVYLYGRCGPPPEVQVLLDCVPGTLNLKSKGKWITCYVELPQPLEPTEIDASSVLLNGNLSPVLDLKYGFVSDEQSYIVDHDENGVLERMFKFNRSQVQAIIQVGESIEITITGKLNSGISFSVTDTVRVINPG